MCVLCVLFEADEAADECHAVELVFRQFKRLVFRIVGHNEDMLLVGATPYALDERPL